MVRFVLIFLILAAVIPSSGQSVGRFYVVKDGPKQIDSLGSFQFLANEAVLFENGLKRLDKFIKYYSDSAFAGNKIAIMINPATTEETSDLELCDKRLNTIVSYLTDHSGLRTTDLISVCVTSDPPSGFVSFAKLPRGVKQSNIKVKYIAPKINYTSDVDVRPKFDKWKSTLDNYVWENFACRSNKKNERVQVSVRFVIDSVGYVRKGSVEFIRNGNIMNEPCRKRLVKILEKSPRWSPARNSKLNLDVTS